MSYCIAKVMPKFTENFGMTFAKNRAYGVPEFAGTEVNQHSSNLKGLMGYLQTFRKGLDGLDHHHMHTSSTTSTSNTSTTSNTFTNHRHNHNHHIHHHIDHIHTSKYLIISPETEYSSSVEVLLTSCVCQNNWNYNLNNSLLKRNRG